MLQLSHIRKDYDAGDSLVHALQDVSISFRENEFVSILGPSGCGKTTLLNIIGGLDHYTEGDLIIGGASTKSFHDADWDTYRNHSIGFVFQSYNLIPHQTVLANVELALTLSGVGKAERRRRAVAALQRVGLGDQLRKRPNQMSGGQMQRVAIARALVNDPEILLADEPTGALDSETSTQVMDLLREVAQDRLVIMVTHNQELAEQYSTRIVRLLDGRIIGDTNPYDPETELQAKKTREKTGKKHPGMSFITALNLSTNNLLTKKGRTLLTAFAGSIGIIGIALILSLSHGVQKYIDQVQEDTLTSYPITIQAEETDMTSLVSSMMGLGADAENAHEKDAVYSNAVMYQLMDTMMNAETRTNDLRSFKQFLDDTENNGLAEYVTNIQYSYDVNLNIYARDINGDWSKSDILALWENMMGDNSVYSGISDMTSVYSQFSTLGSWQELQSGADGALIAQNVVDDYELLYGRWPESYDEVVLIVSDNNEVSDIILYCLGLVTQEDMTGIMTSAIQEQTVDVTQQHWSYEDICGIDLRLLLSTDFFVQQDDGVWQSIADNDALLNMAIENGVPLRITGILRSTEENQQQTGTLGYTAALTEYIIDETEGSAIVQDQLDPANENVDVFTGLPFEADGEEPTNAQKAEQISAWLTEQPEQTRAEIYLDMMSRPDEALVEQTVEAAMQQLTDRESLDQAVLNNYAQQTGVSEDTIRTYLEGLSDDELRTMVRQAVAEQTRESMTQAGRQALLDQAQEQSQSQDLQQAAALIAQQVLAQTTKLEYICGVYLQQTALDAQTIYQWLSGLDQAQTDSIFDDMMLDLAREYTDETAGEAALAPQLSASLTDWLQTAEEDDLAALYDCYMPASVSDSTLSDNLRTLGVLDLDNPSTVNIYVDTFAAKDRVADIIQTYNEGKSEEEQITYTDYVALLMSSVTTVINAISYVLVAFVSISLVVSSIMIGIITYISVLERTKEIGILRAIGAAKRDVARVFNAETMIIGFSAGAIGIGVTLLLIIPINLIVYSLTDIANLKAILPWQGAVALVVISVLLTLLAGLIPARIAAKKDPVEALRTE